MAPRVFRMRPALHTSANADGSQQAGPALRLAGSAAFLSAAAQHLSHIVGTAAGSEIRGRLEAGGVCVLLATAPLSPPNLLILPLPPPRAWLPSRIGWQVVYTPEEWPNGLSPTTGDVLLCHALALIAAQTDATWRAAPEALAWENAYRGQRGVPARRAGDDL